MKIAKLRLSDGQPPVGVELAMPPELKVTCLFGADRSDPINQARRFEIKVGTLGFRLEEPFIFEHPERVIERFVKATLIIGMEHGAEIRDALKNTE